VTQPTLLAAPAMAESPDSAVRYRLFVASTVTGQIVYRDMPFVGSPRWTYGLNLNGGLTPTVPLSAVTKGDFEELSQPWRWSWGLAYGSHILQYGPCVTDRYTDQDGPPTAEVGCTGLWGLWAKRILIDPWWSEGRNVADPLADSVYNNLTLRTIAKRLVQSDLIRAGHGLPIVLPDDDPAGTNQRTYPGYDLATIGERLTQLTQVIDGPQLGYPHSWDYGKALSHVDYDRDGSHMTMGHFERGNGMERGLLSAYQDDKSLVNVSSYPWPDLETVGSSSTSVTEQSTLQAAADGQVATYARPIVTWSATVRMDGTNGQGRVTRSPSIDQLSVGDNATFQLTGHRRIADGTYQRRILGVSNGPNLYSAQLTLQPTS
jgi:hypothetical protein